MKKVNFLEIFLFMLCIICFIVGMINFYSIFSNVATLLFPDNTDYGTYGNYDNLVYIKRSLFSNVPMLVASASIFFFSFKKALFEHNKKDTI